MIKTKYEVHINWYILLSFIVGYIYSNLIFLVYAQREISDSVKIIINIVHILLITLIPTYLYIRNTSSVVEFKKEYFNKINKQTVVILIVVGVLIWGAGNYLNAFIVNLFSKIKIYQLEQLPGYGSIQTVILGFINVVIVAPIFEELFFRGIVMSGYKKYGIFAMVIASSLFFALGHGIAIFTLPFIYGIFAGIAVYKTKSVYSGILLHGICNLLSWLMDLLKINASWVDNLIMVLGIIFSILVVTYLIFKFRYLYKKIGLAIRIVMFNLPFVLIILIYLIRNF